MNDTNPTRARAARNKKAFDDVIGDALSDEDTRQGHYPRLRHRSLLQASRPNLDETAGRIIASKPNAIDFCVDVESVLTEVLGNDPALLDDFLDTYITGDEESIKNSNISQTERSYIEQRMGRLFLTRGLSPVAKYFL